MSTSNLNPRAPRFIPGVQPGQLELKANGNYSVRWSWKALNKETNQLITLRSGTNIPASKIDNFEFQGQGAGKKRRTKRVRKTRKSRKSRKSRIRANRRSTKRKVRNGRKGRKGRKSRK